MAATVVEKPRNSGKWYVQVCKDGRRKLTKMPSRTIAEKKARQVNATLVNIDLGLVTPKKNAGPTFAEYAEQWLENDIKPPARAVSTYNRYRSMLEIRELRNLRDVPLPDVTRAMIKQALKDYHRSGKSSDTVKLLGRVISSIFGYAIDDELVKHNPASSITKKLNLPADRREIEPLTLKESQQVLNCLKNGKYYPLFLFLFRTGARIGEGLALRWDDINFSDNTAKIRRTAKEQYVSEKPKTASSIREVELTPDLVAELRKLNIAWKTKRIAGHNCSYIFQTKNSRLYAHATITGVFHRALEKQGLPRRGLHNIRHSYASILLSMGVPPIYVSRMLGHSSISFTIDRYGHWIRDDKNRYGNLLDGTGNLENKGGLLSLAI